MAESEKQRDWKQNGKKECLYINVEENDKREKKNMSRQKSIHLHVKDKKILLFFWNDRISRRYNSHVNAYLEKYRKEILKLKEQQNDRENNGNMQQIYNNYIIYTKVRFGKRGKWMQTSSQERQAKSLYLPKFNL